MLPGDARGDRAGEGVLPFPGADERVGRKTLGDDTCNWTPPAPKRAGESLLPSSAVTAMERRECKEGDWCAGD